MARPWQFIVSTIASFWSYFNCVKISYIYTTEPFLGGIQRFCALFSCFSLMFPSDSTSSSQSLLSCLLAQAPADSCTCSWTLTSTYCPHTSYLSSHLAQPSYQPQFHVLCSLFSPVFSFFFSSTWVLWTSYSVVFICFSLKLLTCTELTFWQLFSNQFSKFSTLNNVECSLNFLMLGIRIRNIVTSFGAWDIWVC